VNGQLGRRSVQSVAFFDNDKIHRQPHYFTRADGKPMALAGLWGRWRSKEEIQ
jgi:putative SOS response-associated peptidase YedK